MRMLVLMLCAATFAGCASGAPASIDRAAAPQAVVPVSTLGFRPEVQAFMGMPIDVTDCVVNTGTNILKDLVGGARCVLNKIVPIVAEQPASAPQYVEVEEQYMVPETRMVPRTRMIRKQLVPVQSAPCAPAPQSAPAPRSGCEPPPSPVACADGQSCGIHR